MKCITKDDLILLLNNYSQNTWNAKQLASLPERFGDDWVFDGGEWIKTDENQDMIVIRDRLFKQPLRVVSK